MRALRDIVNRKLEMTLEDGLTGMFACVDVAAVRGNLAALKALCMYGRARIEPKAAHHKGPNPLYFACMNGHLAAAKWLVARGARAWTVRHSTNHSPLTMAIFTACDTDDRRKKQALLKTIDWLLTDNDLDVDSEMPGHQVNGLYYACSFGEAEIAHTLLSHGADANFTRPDLAITAFSPLACAAVAGDLHLLSVLVVDGDAEVDMQGPDRVTALHIAASMGHLTTVEWLVIECSADHEAVDKDGNSPIHLACDNGYLDIVAWLITQGTGVNIENSLTGETPLHVAASRGWLDTVKLLVDEFGASVNARRKHPKTGEFLGGSKPACPSPIAPYDPPPHVKKGRAEPTHLWCILSDSRCEPGCRLTLPPCYLATVLPCHRA